MSIFDLVKKNSCQEYIEGEIENKDLLIISYAKEALHTTSTECQPFRLHWMKTDRSEHMTLLRTFQIQAPYTHAFL